MSAGCSRRTTERQSSSAEIVLVWKPSASKAALSGTAVSRSSRVMRILSAISGPSLPPGRGPPRARPGRPAPEARHAPRRDCPGRFTMRVFPLTPATPRARGGTVEFRVGSKPDRLGDAGRFLLQHHARGLRRHVARGEAGAAGGEDEVDGTAIGPSQQHRHDGRGFVGHEGALRHRVALAAGPRRNRVTRAIGALAPCPGVAHGQDARDGSPGLPHGTLFPERARHHFGGDPLTATLDLELRSHLGRLDRQEGGPDGRADRMALRAAADHIHLLVAVPHRIARARRSRGRAA